MTTDTELLRGIYMRLGDISDRLTELQAMLASRSGEGVSSLTIEDMAKGAPKITSKFYDSVFSFEEIQERLEAHAYAHREAEQRYMDNWAQTVDGLKSA